MWCGESVWNRDVRKWCLCCLYVFVCCVFVLTVRCCVFYILLLHIFFLLLLWNCLWRLPYHARGARDLGLPQFSVTHSLSHIHIHLLTSISSEIRMWMRKNRLSVSRPSESMSFILSFQIDYPPYLYVDWTWVCVCVCTYWNFSFHSSQMICRIKWEHILYCWLQCCELNKCTKIQLTRTQIHTYTSISLIRLLHVLCTRL